MKRVRYGDGTKFGPPIAMYPSHELRTLIEQMAFDECRSLGKQLECLVREALAARASKGAFASALVRVRPEDAARLVAEAQGNAST